MRPFSRSTLALPLAAAALAAALTAAPAQAAGGFKADLLQDLQGVSDQIVQLAQAIPAEKYGWRPAPGVRSVSEVFMHIVNANFYLLSITGPKMPSDMKEGMEKSVTSKPEVISWLKRSLAAVKEAHAQVKPADMQRHVTVFKRDATVDGMYLRILVHENEHYGQMIAYARSIGVTPPWAKNQ